jgi:predicted ATPase
MDLIVKEIRPVEKIRKPTLESLTEIFDRAVVDAVNYLRSVMHDENADEENRIKAALSIMKSGDYLVRRSQINTDDDPIY